MSGRGRGRARGDGRRKSATASQVSKSFKALREETEAAHESQEMRMRFLRVLDDDDLELFPNRTPATRADDETMDRIFAVQPRPEVIAAENQEGFDAEAAWQQEQAAKRARPPPRSIAASASASTSPSTAPNTTATTPDTSSNTNANAMNSVTSPPNATNANATNANAMNRNATNVNATNGNATNSLNGPQAGESKTMADDGTDEDDDDEEFERSLAKLPPALQKYVRQCDGVLKSLEEESLQHEEVPLEDLINDRRKRCEAKQAGAQAQPSDDEVEKAAEQMRKLSLEPGGCVKAWKADFAKLQAAYRKKNGKPMPPEVANQARIIWEQSRQKVTSELPRALRSQLQTAKAALTQQERRVPLKALLEYVKTGVVPKSPADDAENTTNAQTALLQLLRQLPPNAVLEFVRTGTLPNLAVDPTKDTKETTDTKESKYDNASKDVSRQEDKASKDAKDAVLRLGEPLNSATSANPLNSLNSINGAPGFGEHMLIEPTQGGTYVDAHGKAWPLPMPSLPPLPSLPVMPTVAGSNVPKPNPPASTAQASATPAPTAPAPTLNRATVNWHAPNPPGPATAGPTAPPTASVLTPSVPANMVSGQSTVGVRPSFVSSRSGWALGPNETTKATNARSAPTAGPSVDAKTPRVDMLEVDETSPDDHEDFAIFDGQSSVVRPLTSGNSTPHTVPTVRDAPIVRTTSLPRPFGPKPMQPAKDAVPVTRSISLPRPFGPPQTRPANTYGGDGSLEFLKPFETTTTHTDASTKEKAKKKPTRVPRASASSSASRPKTPQTGKHGGSLHTVEAVSLPFGGLLSAQGTRPTVSELFNRLLRPDAFTSGIGFP